VGILLRAVFLDLGETLVHLDRPWDDVFHADLQALHTYLCKLGLEFDYDKFAEKFIRVFDDASAKADVYKIEIPMQEIISKVMKKSGLQVLGLDLPTSATVEFYRPEVEAWQVYPDTIETLSELKERGFEMGLISNSKSDWLVRSIVQRRDLERFFKVIVTSAAVRIRKPRAEIFTEALKGLKVKALESVFVGDSIQADVSGANSLGMHSIHILRKPITTPHLTNPDATVTSLAEVLKVITAWSDTGDDSAL
jgi:HAD superfamily hydrolase (TIGR01662 family)